MKINRFAIRISGIACAIVLTIFCINVLASDLTPEQTVNKYYNALKNQDYEQAYDCISKKMKDGRDRETWAKDWKDTVVVAKIEIVHFSVSECKIDGDKATVRVSVNAKDIFNKDGLTENETDYMVIEDSVWKIDATEVDLPDI